ncbi:hypothetical protein [uncultured Campylobacter sp.]|uniref:hypothetical protein n=1 Tax=uncultured Campylobacter sp. TaxID=218934 RepID=UPI00260CFDB4|nr:hypothetical protein [uncultured Campylobacter sp.]
MGAERCKKSVKARGGIEWGSATAANQARKLRIKSGLKQKARRANFLYKFADKKASESKSSARRFTDWASGSVGGAECKFGEKINV